MLSNFPARDVDEPITKDFLRAELAEGFSKADARLHSSMKWMIATMLALWSLQLTAIVVFR